MLSKICFVCILGQKQDCFTNIHQMKFWLFNVSLNEVWVGNNSKWNHYLNSRNLQNLWKIWVKVCNTFHDNASHLIESRILVEGFKGDLIESQNLNLISLDITKKTKAGLWSWRKKMMMKRKWLFLSRDHPYITSAHFWIFLGPSTHYVSINTFNT